MNAKEKSQMAKSGNSNKNQQNKNTTKTDANQLVDAFQSHNLFKNLILPENLDTNYRELLNSSWRINDILPDDARLTVIYGMPKSYKSFVALDMALSVATGIDYHGHKTRACSVLYIAAEGQKGITKRIKAWLQVRGIDKLENFFPFVKPITINDDKACKELINFLKLFPVKPELIFIDTLNRSMRGNENGDDMTAFVAGVTEISVETGAQVVVIHHTPKNGEGMRGHSSLHGAVDYSYLIEKHKKIQNVAVMSCDNAKDHDDKGVMFFNMPIHKIVDAEGNPDTDADGKEISSLVPIINAELSPEPVTKNQPKGKQLQVLNALVMAIKQSKDDAATLEQWKEAFYSEHGKESSERKAFSTHHKSLIAQDYVLEMGDLYFIK